MTTRPANNRVQAVTSQQAISNENARLRQQVDELRQQLAQMTHSPPPASPPPWTATTPDVTTHSGNQLNSFTPPSYVWTPTQRPTTVPTSNSQRVSSPPLNDNILSTPTTATPFRCYNCNEIGHMRRRCPYLLQTTGNDWSRTSSPVQARGVTENDAGSAKVYLPMTINRRRYLGLLDSGCETTIIPAKMVGKTRLLRTNQRCFAANGTTIPIKGFCTIRAQTGNSDCLISGLVTEHVEELMLGIDFLKDNDALWDFHRNELVLRNQVHRLEARKRRNTWCRRVILMEDTTVPPMSQLNVNTKAVFREPRDAAYTARDPAWGTEVRQLKDGLLVARTLLPNKAENLPVRLLNATEQPIKLRKDTVVSDLEPLQPVIARSTQSDAYSTDDDAMISEMVNKVHPDVPVHIRQRLTRIIHNRSNVFSKHEYDLGYTDILQHHIDIGDSKPFRQPLRRFPPAHHNIIDEHVNTMLHQGVITPASSPFASNVVLARKKDGTYRCCVDYRQLNDITKKDAYPLPLQDAVMEAMTGSVWFSTFDLKSSYHQLGVLPQDQEKTAFITRRGQYQYQRMAFGLCNAPASFQRMMDILFNNLNYEICLVYFDDLICYSRTLEDHLERLDRILERLQSANLKLKPTKCCIMQTSVRFLGHIISGSGLSTDPEKIRLITDWPTPTNVKDVRAFLGLAGYYRKFVKDYARTATPLNGLMKKNQVFNWTSDCQQAFDELKQRLTTSPILTLPNNVDTIIIDCDASQFSIGSVLSQLQNGEERVIAYAGRALNQNEINYCITRAKNCLQLSTSRSIFDSTFWDVNSSSERTTWHSTG